VTNIVLLGIFLDFRRDEGVTRDVKLQQTLFDMKKPHD
jgi:hypothetical protein